MTLQVKITHSEHPQLARLLTSMSTYARARTAFSKTTMGKWCEEQNVRYCGWGAEGHMLEFDAECDWMRFMLTWT